MSELPYIKIYRKVNDSYIVYVYQTHYWDSLEHVLKLSGELMKDIPILTPADVRVSKIMRSMFRRGFTIVYASSDIPPKDYIEDSLIENECILS